jgi:hypothetical protein
MDAEATVRDYYEALRGGEPLHRYFLESERTVKFGVGERLTGYGAVAAGLREQTATTDGWEVTSSRLLVEERADGAWFSDDVFMGWNDAEAGVRYEFDTRWSGPMVRLDDAAADAETDPGPGRWRFAGMHVSVSVRGRRG